MKKDVFISRNQCHNEPLSLWKKSLKWAGAEKKRLKITDLRKKEQTAMRGVNVKRRLDWKREAMWASIGSHAPVNQ